MGSFNFCQVIQDQIRRHPNRLALSVPRQWSSSGLESCQDFSYRELGQRVTLRCQDLRSQGLGPGDRVVIFFPVSGHLIVLLIALFAIGATPTFIDPGMGYRRALSALKIAKAKALITTPFLSWLKVLVPRFWSQKFLAADFGQASAPNIDPETDPFAWQIAPRQDHHEGIVTFTSGTSGQPKASNRTRRILQGQHEALSRSWQGVDQDVVLTCFPITCLFFICHGVSCLLPAVNLRAPANVQPEVILQQMLAYKVTTLFGAPAFLEKVVSTLREHAPNYPLRSLVSGGAPTPYRLIRSICEGFPDCQSTVVYGSTEAEPIAYTPMAALVDEDGSQGYCVGTRVEDAQVMLVDPNMEPWATAPTTEDLRQRQVPAGAAGELLVAGPHVIQEYLNHEEANRATKIRTQDGCLWHRTGDIARITEQGKIYLLGRRQEEISSTAGPVYPGPLEAQLELLPGVHRAALVELGGGTILGLQTEEGASPPSGIKELLQCWGVSVTLVDVTQMPVDRRHNSKIDRLALKRYVQRQGVAGV